MREEIILLGAGGHCKSCIDVIEQSNAFEIRGIIDIKEHLGKNILGYQVIGSDEDLERLVAVYKNYLIAIGQMRHPDTRIRLSELIRRLGGQCPVVISPRAYVSKHATIGKGTIVMHNAVVNAGATIGEYCIINTGSIIEHDATIGNYCHISTNATINGGAVVKERSFVGSKAVTKEYVTIGENSFVPANTLMKTSKEEVNS